MISQEKHRNHFNESSTHSTGRLPEKLQDEHLLQEFIYLQNYETFY